MRSLCTFFLLLISSPQVWAGVTSQDLFNAINERLSYMEDVALFKAQQHLPIENIERENVVLDKAKMSAFKQGLDPDSIEGFFEAQISVAKAIQFRYRADLLFEPSVEKAKNLQNEVRPLLLELGEQIIRKLSMYLKNHDSIEPSLFSEFDASIDIKYVTTLEKKQLFEALRKVKRLSD